MEPSREDMADTVEWLRGLIRCADESGQEMGYVDDLTKQDAKALIAYIDLLEKRVRELGGEP